VKYLTEMKGKWRDIVQTQNPYSDITLNHHFS